MPQKNKVPNFKSLDLLHKHLESDALNYEYSHNIGNLFQKLRDGLIEAGRDEEARLAQTEIDVMNFMFVDGKAKPQWEGVDANGEPVKYPSFDKIDDKSLFYIDKRLLETQNPFLAAKYAHTLWCSPNKHAKYAEVAIGNYLALIKIYEERKNKDQERHYGLDLVKAVQNAYHLANNVKYKQEGICREVRRIVGDFPFSDRSSLPVILRLIRLLIGERKRMEGAILNGLQDICNEFAHYLRDKNNIHAAIDAAELGKEIDKLTDNNSYPWDELIASITETLFVDAKEKNDPAAIHFCKNAMQVYKSLGRNDKITELEAEYDRLRKNWQLGTIRTEIDLSEAYKASDIITDEMSAKAPEEIIKYLTYSRDLIPSYDNLEKFAEEAKDKYPLQSIFSSKIIDEQGNSRGHFSTEEEIQYHNILQNFMVDITIFKKVIIERLIYSLMKEEALTIGNVFNYLKENSWFGLTLKSSNYKGEETTHNWLEVIMPSIGQFFVEMQIHFASPSYSPNLILSIDSLVLKMEGILRDLIQFGGGNTFIIKKDNKGRDITAEKNINILLREKIIENALGKDDTLFLKVLLVEQAGFNLRNEVSHCLLSRPHYSFFHTCLLFIALLKLGRFDLASKAEKALE